MKLKHTVRKVRSGLLDGLNNGLLDAPTKRFVAIVGVDANRAGRMMRVRGMHQHMSRRNSAVALDLGCNRVQKISRQHQHVDADDGDLGRRWFLDHHGGRP